MKDFEDDFVVYLTKKTTKCKWSKLITILEDNEESNFVGW